MARVQRWQLVLYLSFFAFLAYLGAPYFTMVGVKLWHNNPLSYERQVENYNFQATAQEEQCFAGKNNFTDTEPIPKVVHFIWGLKEGKGSHARFGFIEYLSIRSALVALQPDEVKVHYASLDQNGEWFQKVKEDITLVHHDPNVGVLAKTKTWQAAHRADVLRLDILHEEGGIYMDLDTIALQPFDTILQGEKDIIMGHEGGNRAGMANAVIVARKGSKFIDRWIKSYDTFSTSEWNYHSVTLPKEMSQQYPEEICTLSPVAFFWPTWTYHHVEMMHSPLTLEAVRSVEQDLHDNGGALFKDQLAYHAWSQMAWGPYLKNLTPELIRTQNTRFNIMVRRFLN